MQEALLPALEREFLLKLLEQVEWKGVLKRGFFLHIFKLFYGTKEFRGKTAPGKVGGQLKIFYTIHSFYWACLGLRLRYMT